MATLTATPTAGLYAVLKAAAPGDVVQLEAGSYGPFDVYQMNKAAPGVIVEAAPGAVATISGINLNESDGWTFRSGEGTLVVTPLAKTGFAIYFGGARNRFMGLKIAGDPATFRTAGQNGVMIRNALGGAVVDCELSYLNTGINHLNPLNAGDTILIAGNRLHDLRSDGIRGQSSNIDIVDNKLWDFYPAPEDHPDGIQFYTTGLSAPLKNITIRGNDIRKGKGGPIQGIFVGNENKVPFENLVVTGNIVAGGMWHGLSISYANKPVVDRNYVVGMVDSIAVDGQIMTPWIQVANSNEPLVRGNVASAYRFTGSTGLVEAANLTVTNSAAGDDTAATAFALKGAPAPVEPVPPEPAPAPDDPRDARIAALEAQVATLTSQLGAAQTEAAALKSRADRLIAQIASGYALARQARAAKAKNQYLDPLVALLSAPAP